ncbi:MAG: response regulator [Desulfococcaceae bacterium]
MKKNFDRLPIRKKLTWLMFMNAGLIMGLISVFLLINDAGYLQGNIFGKFFTIFLLSCAAARFLSVNLEKIIVTPVLELAAMMKTVSEQKEYSLRAERKAQDETGILFEGFNEMLTQIKNRDKELEMYKNHIEEMVNRRTEELEKSLAELKTAKEAAETAGIAMSRSLNSSPAVSFSPEKSQDTGIPKKDGSAEDISCKYERPSVRALLVEDNPVSQFVGQKILEHLACTVDTASDGIQAVEMFSRAEYNIVFMDCQMPKMDGYTATQEIRKYERLNSSCHRTPVIALTAHAMEEEQKICLAAGMDDFITKPFLPAQLESALKKWCPCEKKESGTVPEAGGSENIAESCTSAENPVLAADRETAPSADMAVLDNIRALQRDGSPDILKKVLSHYLEHTPKLIDELEKAIQEGNMKAISETAHSMKSGCGNVGAMPLFELCRKMEAIGRGRAPEESTDTADSVFMKIRSEYEKVKLFLQKEMGKQTQ